MEAGPGRFRSHRDAWGLGSKGTSRGDRQELSPSMSLPQKSRSPSLLRFEGRGQRSCPGVEEP